MSIKTIETVNTLTAYIQESDQIKEDQSEMILKLLAKLDEKNLEMKKMNENHQKIIQNLRIELNETKIQLNEWNALKKAQDAQDKLDQDLAARKTKVESDYRSLAQKKESFEQEKIEMVKAADAALEEKRAKIQKLRDELTMKKSLIENRVPIDVDLYLDKLDKSDELVHKLANFDLSLYNDDFDESEFEKTQEAHQQEKKTFDDKRKAFEVEQVSIQKKIDGIDKEINAMKEKFIKFFQLHDQYFKDL